MKRLLATTVMILGTGACFSGCNTRKDYPEPYLGWHDSSYSKIFGRLVRVPGPTADDAPTWIVRFGMPGDNYRGELKLTPPERMVGYTGGEAVELRGRVSDQATTDAFSGRTYVVDSIQMWSNYR